VPLDKPIKHIGLVPVNVVLHPEVRVPITLNVARSEEEAERQARGEDVARREDGSRRGRRRRRGTVRRRRRAEGNRRRRREGRRRERGRERKESGISVSAIFNSKSPLAPPEGFFRFHIPRCHGHLAAFAKATAAE